MVSAEVEGLHELWGGYLGFDLKLSIEVDLCEVFFADDGGMVPLPTSGGSFPSKIFSTTTEDEVALGVEAEKIRQCLGRDCGRG